MFEIDGAKCIKQTEKAILISAPDFFDDPVWLPQSVITDDSEVQEEGDVGTCVVEEWFARKQGWY